MTLSSFNTTSFDSEKPCTNIKFEFEDQRRRQFNKILVDKIENLLDGNLEELEERVRCKLPRSVFLYCKNTRFL